ncbi:MAG: FAD-binding oxidoreductase, partial [Deltaproteobacteria bacterium]
MLTVSVKKRFRDIVGDAGFISGDAALEVYECDGYTLARSRPELVLLPSTTDQVRRAVALCHEQSIPFVPRGAGTGLSGGCLPEKIPVMIGTARMRRIRSIDLANRAIEVEAGVVNLEVTRRTA